MSEEFRDSILNSGIPGENGPPGLPGPDYTPCGNQCDYEVVAGAPGDAGDVGRKGEQGNPGREGYPGDDNLTQDSLTV